MLNIDAQCNGAFIGHAIASNYDPSISMAVNITDSLLEHNKFIGPDILSRYLDMYRTEQSEIGGTTKYLYQIALKNIQSAGNKPSISRQDFVFDQPLIDEYVKNTDKNFDGKTAGCSPAQRSFPLALCSWINDDDLFELSMKDAALTHYSPLAGQVAGIVNIICRSLLKKNSWNDAVRSAFYTPRLHPDIKDVYAHYGRSSNTYVRIHDAYAPTMLHTTLNYIRTSTNAVEAIDKARTQDPYFCAPVVGVLSGVLWGIPQEMYSNKVNDAQFTTIRNRANQLSSRWPSKYEGVTN